MGCDIHLFLEVRFPKGSRWHPLAREVLVLRDYTLFGVLAGVRAEDGVAVPVVPPRGLPEDLSGEVVAVAGEWDTSGHTHSYLSFAEATEAQRRYGRLRAEEEALLAPAVRVGGFDLQAILAYLEFYERAGLTTRLVFWFDN